MQNRETKERRKTDAASSSQFLMIAVVAAIAIVVMLLWRPWTTRPVNGVPQSVVATASP